MFESQVRLGATPEIVKRALDFSVEVSDLIDRFHPESIAEGTRRTAVAMASFMVTLEHRHSVLLLIHHGGRSSAAALIRPTHEAYFRGMWALKVAHDQQIAEIFGKHPRVPTLDAVLQQLRKNPTTSGLAAYNSWKSTGDYVHSGPLQLQRWISREGIEPQHSDDEAVVMLEVSDCCGLLATIGMNEACGLKHPELHAKLRELALRGASRRVVAAYRGRDHDDVAAPSAVS